MITVKMHVEKIHGIVFVHCLCVVHDRTSEIQSRYKNLEELWVRC